MKKNFRIPQSQRSKPAVNNNAGITSNITPSNKEITSEEALKDSSAIMPQVVPATNVMRAPEQTTDPIIVNNIVMRSVDRTQKDIGTWREDHRAAEAIYFPMRSRLYDLYMDVELDGHLTGIWSRRVSAAVNKKIRFVGKDKKPVDKMNELIKSLEFRKMMKEMMKVITWGVTGFEFLPGEKFAFKVIPKKHIKPEKKVIAINQTDFTGIPYENVSNIWVIGDDRDLGLLLKCAFYVLLKKGNFSDWANYIEIFGSPVIVTKYSQYDAETKKQLTVLMEKIGNSLKLAIPKEADFEIIDGKTSNGNGDLQDKFKDACNDELSILILTVTETTKSGKSSGYAQSKTQSDEQFEVTQDDVFMLLALLNSEKFLNILSSYGYPIEGGSFVIEENMKLADQQTFANVLDIVKNNLKVPVGDDFIYDTFNIPKPDDYNAQKLKLQQSSEAAPDPSEDKNPINVPKPAPGKKGVAVKPVPGKDPAKANLSQWQTFRIAMANFFDPAHKD